MDQLGLDKYLQGMENGEWGDGIMLSAAVRLYGRPIVVITPDGAEQLIDAAQESAAERMLLGLINNNHYVSINKVSHDPASKSIDLKSQQTVTGDGSDASSMQSATPNFDADCKTDISTTVFSSTALNKKTDDSNLEVGYLQWKNGNFNV
jgi:hypothetical protein